MTPNQLEPHFELEELRDGSGRWKATFVLFNDLESVTVATATADSPGSAVEKAEDAGYQALERVIRGAP